MARKPRIDLVGFHHVANQGMYKANIFATILEKEKFLAIVCKACDAYHITLHDYCIMDNHYHLLLETKRENLSYFMRQINGNYAIYFNRKQERSGPLWKGRYKSWYIVHEEYLEYTIKYIEYDPIKANLSFFPSDYPYTLSAAILGTGTIVPCAQKSLMIEKYTERELKQFLQSDLTKDELGALDDEKRKKIVQKKSTVKTERETPLDEYFKHIHTKPERNIAMQKAYLDGYSQGEIAKLLNVSSALVSYCIKRLP
jgi:REP element-mobilizing transposase RayT